MPVVSNRTDGVARGGLGRFAAAWAFLVSLHNRAFLAWGAAALLGAAAGSLAIALSPLALKKLVDELGGARPDGFSDVLAPVGLYVLSLLAARIIDHLMVYALGRSEQCLTRSWSTTAFLHMLRLPVTFHLDSKAGALAHSLSEAANGLRLILAQVVMSLAPVLVQIAVAAAVVGALFDLGTALVLVVALLAYSAVFAWGASWIAGPARAVSTSEIEAAGFTGDALTNVESLKTFTAEKAFAARYNQLLLQRETHARRFGRRRMINGVAVAAVFGVTLVVTSLIAVERFARGEATLGTVVLIYAYLLQLLRPLEMVGFGLRDIAHGWASLEKLLDTLQRPTEAEGEPCASVEAEGPADLEFDQVDFAAPNGRMILADTSFRTQPGGILGIVGPSGAGKSSILKLVLRLYEPSSGSIRLDGRPLGAWPLDQLREQIAVVSQDTTLFNDTIRGNIVLAKSEVDDAAIREAVAKAELTDFVNRLPEGLDTVVGDRGMKLSGGERQRVSIARAAVRKARLVLLDEATAALDAGTEGAIWESLHSLREGATTIIVTHRLASIMNADLILVLRDGAIVEKGQHTALLARGGLYATLWREQTRELRRERPTV